MTNKEVKLLNLSTSSDFKFKIKLIRKAVFDEDKLTSRIEELIASQRSGKGLYQQIKSANKAYNNNNLSLKEVEKFFSDYFYGKVKK